MQSYSAMQLVQSSLLCTDTELFQWITFIRIVSFQVPSRSPGLPSFNTVTFNADLMCDNRLKSCSLVQTAILV